MLNAALNVNGLHSVVRYCCKQPAPIKVLIAFAKFAYFISVKTSASL